MSILIALLIVKPFPLRIVQITHAFLIGQQIIRYKIQKILIILTIIFLTTFMNIYLLFSENSLLGFLGLQFFFLGLTLEVILHHYPKSEKDQNQFKPQLAHPESLLKRDFSGSITQQVKHEREDLPFKIDKSIYLNQPEPPHIIQIGENELDQQDLFVNLINMFPDGIVLKLKFQGVVILAEKNEIVFVNKRLRQLFKSTLNDEDIIQKLLQAKNCAEKLKEENQFKFLFKKLNEKYQNDTRKKPIFKQSLLGTFEEYNLQHNVEENSETVERECQKQLQKLIVEFEMTNRQYQFLEEKAMLCYIEEEQPISEECSQFGSNNLQTQSVFEVFFKPYMKENKPNILLIVRDVSYFNQLKAMKTVNINKSKMLSQVSHEFRTPLNCITLMIQSLMLELDQKKNEEYCDPILASTNQLLSLVNDILDVAQLKAGKFKLNYNNFDLLKLLQEIQKLMRLQFSKKEIEFIIIKEKNSLIKSDENRIIEQNGEVPFSSYFIN